ncbi:LPS translocon maturation chaperone LptM [Catenovulum sediminis]|uniref:Lipoprotein n=1 Tax=Catenovulum sediminis TaxID=1740262 RepID=A0ABV1RHN9_9ALTE|nr:lipoprotein [Catenovulum sediminis]
MRFKMLSCILILSAMVAACGQRGPLYLPEPEQQAPQQPADQTK